jgi:hypothetical protein
MALATLFGFVMIAWDMMVAKQAALAPAKAPVADKPTEKAPNVKQLGEVADDDDSEDSKSEQPVWRERLDRRMHGGKRRRRR